MRTSEPNRVWPTGTDYARAVQSPATSFTDLDLAIGTAGTNAMGMPLVASGQNAVVFLVESAGTKHAVRCFLTPPHEGAIRYAALERHLANTAPRALTSARWLTEGIAVGDTTWPVVVMPWVEGVPLNIAVEDMLDEPDRLRELADQWAEVVRSLQRAGVAHGDLQHGNVLVRGNDSLALVDLDGVWVPEIEIGPPAEFGHPNYQHPSRTNAHWGRYVDSFPGALIELALRALAADPALASFLNGENLLFTRADLVDAANAPVWNAVCSSPDVTVASLAASLRQRCVMPITEALVPVDELRTEAEEDPERTVLRTPSAPVASPATPQAVGATDASVPWWEQTPPPSPAMAGVAAAAPVDAAPAPTPAVTASAGPTASSVVLPSSSTGTSPLVWLGKNTIVAGLVGGVLAGVLGSLATAAVAPALTTQTTLVAFVAFISLLLGGFLNSFQALAARNWGSALRRFALGALVGAVAGLVAIAPANAIVGGTAKKVGETATADVVTVPFVTNMLIFALVAALVGYALGLLRSIRSAAWGALAGAVGGAAGGAVFGATVAKYDGTLLVIKGAEPATMLAVAVVGGSIGVMYGAMVRARRRASLTIIEGRNSGLEISVEGKTATIGSKASCDLVIRGADVAPVHASINLVATPPMLTVEESPVALNGTGIMRMSPLKSGDILMVGASFIRVEFQEATS